MSTNRNRIEGGVEQGERANDREALATKARRRKSGDGAGKVDALTWGGLALRLKGRRPSRDDAEREVSRGRSTDGGSPAGATGHRRAGTMDGGKDRTEGRANRP